MPLSIIGAGFGRTGTESLKKALEILGFGPCYHMFEVLPNPDRVAIWRAAAVGQMPDWDQVFAEYNSTVDWPAAFFWRDLAQHYPNSKIILSVRDAESWYESMDNTILPILKDSENSESIGVKLIAEGVFSGNIDDRNHMMDVFNKNILDIQAEFGPDRLLTFELGSGWEPLCQFLGCPIPDETYPRGNNPDEFKGKVDSIPSPASG